MSMASSGTAMRGIESSCCRRGGGGVGSEAVLGDLVVASQVIRHAESFAADPFLLETATGATKAIGLPFHVGTILTVDKVMTAGEGGLRVGGGPEPAPRPGGGAATPRPRYRGPPTAPAGLHLTQPASVVHSPDAPPG